MKKRDIVQEILEGIRAIKEGKVWALKDVSFEVNEREVS